MIGRRSLARRITLTFLACHVGVMLIAFGLLKPIMLSSQDGIQQGPAIAIEAVAAKLRRPRAGGIALAPNGQLAELRRKSPSSWVIARANGHTLSIGTPPDEAWATFGAFPPSIQEAEIRLRSVPPPLGDTAFERRDTEAGPTWIMAGGIHPQSVGLGVWIAYLVNSSMIWALPLIVLLAIPAVLIATPVALRGLRSVTRQAAAMDPAQPGLRLSADITPRELLPLAAAINVALDRLASELERKRRFIADVSHELRTPLAILGMRIAGLPPSTDKRGLERGHARLTDMVGQMLDAERLALRGLDRQPVDLVQVARAVVTESAPLAIRAGYSVALTGAEDAVMVDGEPHAISRAIANLLGNAVAHGGGEGLIEVRIDKQRIVDVIDAGSGIPQEARERVFDPFHRERWDRDGCGLGLHLVQEIMRAHGGQATIPDGAGGRVRLSFPAPAAARHK